MKKYKDEIIRLKEKIRVQNSDIEEALSHLKQTNREKENARMLLSNIKLNEELLSSQILSTDEFHLNQRTAGARNNYINHQLLTDKRK